MIDPGDPDALPGGFPVCRRLEELDPRSGNRVERLVFNHRYPVLLACALATVALARPASRLRVNAHFQDMIPTHHPYLQNQRRHHSALPGQTNLVRVVVENKRGTILQARHLEILRRVSDELFLLPGVDRPYLKSLWTPATRWSAVTEDGLEGGPIIDDRYDGSPASLERVREHLQQSGEIGPLVARDLSSSLVLVPLLERDPDSGARLDYGKLARALEAVRQRHENADTGIHIVGFAAVVGELIAGLGKMLRFFALAVAISLVVLWIYARSLRSAALVVGCSLVAVSWLLGLLGWLGRELDPYTVLVPFLVFAIGVSHGMQKMNGIEQDVARGTHQVVAARYTFRRLFVPGLCALLAAASGFAVLALIDIATLRHLAMAASLGMGALVVTNLILLPVLLSIVPRAAQAPTAGRSEARWLRLLDGFSRRRRALGALVALGLLAAAAFALSLRLEIGTLQAGAPELSPRSRYNRDHAFVTARYGAGNDLLVVLVETPRYRCATYPTLAAVDQLEQRLRRLPGVGSTSSLAGLSKRFSVAMNEGSWKWYGIPRAQGMLNALAARAPRELMSYECDLLPLHVSLRDHKARTLDQVVAEVEAFAADQRRPPLPDAPRFLLAAGNAGVEAATNQVVRQAQRRMLALVCGAILLLCAISFRSWRAVACAAAPLALSALLCEALMVLLGIGVKVATLPVVAVGMGVGVDYALYLLSVTLAGLRRGLPFEEAHRLSLRFTGRVVVLAAITLALAVTSWLWSPIQLQSDMGLLLAFMFVGNMIATLILVPSLGRFLLGGARLERPLDGQRQEAAVASGLKGPVAEEE
jgi:predicted RND superfamily exporter protein